MKNLGKLMNYEVVGNEIKLKFSEQVASVFVINSDIIRFFVPCFREGEVSKAIEEMLSSKCEFMVSQASCDKGERLQITTSQLCVEITEGFNVNIYDRQGKLLCGDYIGDEKGFVRRSADYSLAEAEGHDVAGEEMQYKICVKKQLPPEMKFYGVGEHTGHLNKRETHLVNWNTDNPNPHGETFDRLYKSIPFLIALDQERAYGLFFDNHFETHFDLGRDNSAYYYFAAVDGNLDYYFINGPQIKDVVARYVNLTGKMPLPALWTLGYQQCRWSYESEARLMEVANAFREKDIPCDTLYLDIDYMAGYRVFTWDNERFPNPEAMIKRLNEMGFKVVTIIDPGVKADEKYDVYQEGLEKDYFAKDPEGEVYHNEVWPGDAVYPDFLNSKTRNWWGDLQERMVKVGVSGIWNDMNEPASFKGPLPDNVMFNEDGLFVQHKEVHNVYGHLMAKATYEGLRKHTEKRPFIVTRACYAGSQKYSTVWTGDNQSTWEHLRMSLPMLMNLGLSGMAFCGTDVGGFGFDCSSELLSRWVQVGTFTPLFRNHACMGTRDQEPWAFDTQTEEINRKYIKLRYKLLPYIYDMMWQASQTGSPLIRPLLFNYQQDENTYEINDEFLCGENLLVAPIVTQGSKARMVYLPKGDNWIDYWTHKEYEGGQYIIKEAPLDVCPLYVKANSILVTSKVQNYTGEIKESNKTLEVYLGQNKGSTMYLHYEDAGEGFDYTEGAFNLYEISVIHDEVVKIEINRRHQGLMSSEFTIDCKGYGDKRLYINGQEVTGKDMKLKVVFNN
nr:glycoside hydrolase family 31 protein [uncultured Cellulosilyticum sp.]